MKKDRIIFLMTTIPLVIVGLLAFTVDWNADDETTSTSGQFNAGTYSSEAEGHGGPLEIEVEFDDNEIISVEILSHNETAGIGDVAIERIPQSIIEGQTVDVDTVSGATLTSQAIIEATKRSIAKAEAGEGEDVSSSGQFSPGTYIEEAQGHGGPIEVEVEISESEVVSVTILSHNETAGLGDVAIERIPQALIGEQTADVDTVSGATLTSEAIIEAVNGALMQAALN